MQTLAEIGRYKAARELAERILADAPSEQVRESVEQVLRLVAERDAIMPDTDEAKAPMRRAWRKAEVAASNKQYKRASELFEQAWTLWHPNNGRALTAAGHFAKLAGNAREAQRLFDRSLEDLELQYGATLRVELPGGFGLIESSQWHPKEQLLAVADVNEIALVDAITSRERLRLQGHSSLVTSVALSPDGKTLASGSRDDTVRLWRVTDGSEVRLLKGHASLATSIALSPDGKTLASGSRDNTVRLWRLADGAELRSLKGHIGSVNSVAYSQDGTLLVTASDDGIRLWRADDYSPLLRLLAPDNHDAGITLSGDSQCFDVSGNESQWAIEEALVCRIGPIALRLELCAERARISGLSAKLLGKDPSTFEP